MNFLMSIYIYIIFSTTQMTMKKCFDLTRTKMGASLENIRGISHYQYEIEYEVGRAPADMLLKTLVSIVTNM